MDLNMVLCDANASKSPACTMRMQAEKGYMDAVGRRPWRGQVQSRLAIGDRFQTAKEGVVGN